MAEIEDCATCRFFSSDTPRGNSECHRRAPVVVGQPDGQGWAFWPPVGEAEWCGDFEIDPSITEGEALLCYLCEECEDGTLLPKTEWPTSLCPKCGNDCIPF